MWSALSTQHSALSTQHSALSTQHSALSTQHSALCTLHLGLSKNRFLDFFRAGFVGIALLLFATLSSGTCTYWAYDLTGSRFTADSREGLCQSALSQVATYYSCGSTVDYLGIVSDPMQPHGLCSFSWSGDKYDPITNTCNSAGVKVPIQLECTADTYLSIKGDNEIRPKGAEGKDGKSTLELIAKVMEGSTPKAGVAVTFAVEVEPNTGGHDHHDASRPKGLVNGKLTASGVTEANGEIKVTFQASQIAGTHVVAAVCESCTNKSVTKNVDVKVPDLVPFLVLPLAGMQWNPNGVGDTPQHTDNHYLTMAATYRMLEIASKFKKIWPSAPQLTLNDASLKWGGKFDIDGSWEANPRRHAEHRLGDNVDVRANTRPGNVPSDIRKVVLRWLRDETTAEDKIPADLTIRSVNPLHEGIGEANEHFHLRLGN